MVSTICEGSVSWVDRLHAISGSDWTMVTFYGDESGTGGTGDYAISGYLANNDTWKLFNREWERVLSAPTPRPIKYLKMSQWEHRDPAKKHTGEFLNWNDFDAGIKLDHLVTVFGVLLHSGAIGEYTSSIPWEVYNNSVSGKCKEVFSNPYYFNLFEIIQHATMDTLRFPSFKGKIDFVFDVGNSAEKNAPKHFQYAKRFCSPDVRDKFGLLSFADDKETFPLQAADMIAWHHRRALAGFPKDEDGSRRRRYEFLTNAAKSYSRRYVLQDGLRQFNEAVNELTRKMESGEIAIIAPNEDD